MTDDASTPRFAENVDRVLGLHRLTAQEAGPLLGVSRATISYWRNGHRAPTSDSLRRVCEFFELEMWSLLTAPFAELLPAVADLERFERVERRIERVRQVLDFAGARGETVSETERREAIGDDPEAFAELMRPERRPAPDLRRIR